MARASFFLTRTDADSIKARQLKSGLTLVFLVLVDATATLWLFFTREGKLGALVPELRELTSARAFKGGRATSSRCSRSVSHCSRSPAASPWCSASRGTRPRLRRARGRRRIWPAGKARFANLCSRGASVRRGRTPTPRNFRRTSGTETTEMTSKARPCAACASGPTRRRIPTRRARSIRICSRRVKRIRGSTRASFRRDCIIEGTFLCCIAFQAFVAVKSVAFYYDEHRLLRTVLLFGVSIVAVNAQSAYFRKWVKACTVRTGVLRPDFHAHELQFHDRVVGHVCDMCGLRLIAGSKGLRFGGFRCKTCDFDCCMRCFCRKNRDTAEGGVRGR